MPENDQKMAMPSGVEFDHRDLETLRMMYQYGFLRFTLGSLFTLTSGISSCVYVGGREDLTDNPELLWRIGRRLAKVITAQAQTADKRICLLGVPVVGNTLAHETATVSYGEGILANGIWLAHRVVRENPKSISRQTGWITKPPSEKHSYWLIDNALTTGGSFIKTRENISRDGYSVAGCVVAVDRQQGGLERLKSAKFKRVLVAYQLFDMVYALCKIGIWSEVIQTKFGLELIKSKNVLA